MVQCGHCGHDVSPRARSCPQCGEPGPYDTGSVAATMATVNRTDPYAIAAIVCAIGNFVGLFFVGAILAIVFGKMAEKRIAANPGVEGAGLARAGIVIGWVGLAVGAAIFLLGLTAFGILSGSSVTSVRLVR